MPLTNPRGFWKLMTSIQLDSVPPIQNNWYELFDSVDQNILGIKGIYWKIYQTNDETDAKNIELRVLMDDQVIESASLSLTNNQINYVYLCNDDTPACMLTTILVIWSTRQFFGYSQYFTDIATDDLLNTLPVECHSLKLEYRMTSGLGTNQTLSSAFIGQKLEA